MQSRDEFIPTRQSLLSRLKDLGDQESWRVFFDTYWKLIYSTSVKAGLTDAEAQDAVQETVISVMKSMPNFQYDPAKGTFKSWLLRLTKWRIGDQLRKRQRGIQHQSHGGPGSAGAETADGPVDMEHHVTAGAEFDAMWDEEWEQNLLDAAVERVKKKVDPVAYQLFDLYVLKKWKVSKVANTLKVNPGMVYLTKHRIGHLIKKEIAYLRTKIA